MFNMYWKRVREMRDEKWGDKTSMTQELTLWKEPNLHRSVHAQDIRKGESNPFQDKRRARS